MSRPRRSLDVKALCGTHVLMPQDALDRGVLHAQFLEVGCEAAAVRMPALPLHAVRFEDRFDHAIGKVIKTEGASQAVREDESRSALRLDRVEHQTKRLDDRYKARLIDVFFRLGVLQCASPYTPAYGEHIVAIIVPLQPSNLPLSKPRKSRHADDCADLLCADRRYVNVFSYPRTPATDETCLTLARKTLGNDEWLILRKQLQMLKDLIQAVGKTFPSMLPALGNPDTCSGIAAVVQAKVASLGEDRAERDLHGLVRPMRKIRTVSLLNPIQHLK